MPSAAVTRELLKGLALQDCGVVSKVTEDFVLEHHEATVDPPAFRLGFLCEFDYAITVDVQRPETGSLGPPLLGCAPSPRTCPSIMFDHLPYSTNRQTAAETPTSDA
jgi:hypothetical protein